MRQQLKPTPRRAAFTLVELLLALVITSLLATAVAAMLTGAAKTSQFVTTETDATFRTETAARRIIYNLRHASAIAVPVTTTAGNTLTLVTQSDASNSGAKYTISYYLSGTNLVESDPRYNVGSTPNIIATDIATFSVTRNSLASPQTVLITITTNTSPAVTRSFTVYCRNL
jgi:prepilin-type N-terminal cleavage/methylation domain-containing protein